jgi:hypothetical protein
MQLPYSSPIARYSEIAAKFVLNFANPHRAATAIVRLIPYQTGLARFNWSE